MVLFIGRNMWFWQRPPCDSQSKAIKPVYPIASPHLFPYNHRPSRGLLADDRFNRPRVVENIGYAGVAQLVVQLICKTSETQHPPQQVLD